MAIQHLKKWSSTVLKDFSATDATQIPATVTVDVYREGATVSSGAIVVPFGGTTDVDVYDIGRIQVDDTLQVGTDPSRSLTVTDVVDNVTVTVRNDGSSGVVIDEDERLVITNDRPVLYKDVAGTEAIAGTTGQTTSTVRGLVQFYTTERYFDYIVSAAGVTSTLFTDEESGQVSNRRGNYYNIMDFPGYAPQLGYNNEPGAQVDVEAALATIPTGSRLYFPADEGPYVPPTAAGWELEKAVEIYGDGREHQAGGFWAFESHKDSSIFTMSSANTSTRWIHIHDIVLHGGAAGLPATGGTGDLIRFRGDVYGGTVLERLWLLSAGRSGFHHVPNEGSNTGMVFVSMRNVSVYQAGGHGMFAYTIHALGVDGCSFAACGGCGLHLAGSGDGIVIQHSDFSSNGSRMTGAGAGDMLTDTIPQDFGLSYNAQLELSDCDGIIQGCNVEDFANPASVGSFMRNGITLNGVQGMTVVGNEFDNGTEIADSTSVVLINGASGNTIGSNHHANIDYLVRVADGTTEVGNLIMPQMTAGNTGTSDGKIDVIGGGAYHRNWAFVQNRPSGLADNKGVGILLPMLNSASGEPTTDVDSTVRQEGLLCYNSADNKLYIYNGSAFQVVGAQS